MSDQSDEDVLESQVAKRGPGPVGAARRITAEISDDESDDDANARGFSSSRQQSSPPPSSPSSRRDDDPADRENEDRDNAHRSRDSGAASPMASRSPSPQPPQRQPSPPPQPRRPPRALDSYERNVVSKPEVTPPIHVVHFPPSISFSPAVSTSRFSTLPKEPLPILYRMKRGLPEGKTAGDVITERLRSNPHDPNILQDLFESNAQLVTWSDGSQTIAIGNQHCRVIEDVVASKQLLFRRGEKVQTFEAQIAKVGRVQPSQAHEARAKLASASAVMDRSNARRPVGRMMLRCTEGGEKQEVQARVEIQRRERERARLEARQRQAKEKYVRPNRGLSADILESDDDSGDDRRGGRSDHTERLMHLKRSQHSRPTELSVKRRKVGARRVIGRDDDDSESE